MPTHPRRDGGAAGPGRRVPGEAAPSRGRGRPPTVGTVCYDASVPSFRLRIAALRPFLETDGFEVRTIELGRGREWLRILRCAAQLRACDLLVFQQVKLLAGERALAGRLCGSWILDVDDAIMFRRPRRSGEQPSQARWRQRRFARMAARCRLVVAGSRSLAEMIGTAAPRTEVLFTPVDGSRYPVAELTARERVRLVWIGLGSNVRYLEALAPALRSLQPAGVDFELRVISDRLPAMEGVKCVAVPWSVAGEGSALAACDVGLAPLPDDLWTRGKSAYRCIQYAAAGLPTVASPVGANREVVVDGVSGLTASSLDEWRGALLRLCADVSLRRRLGAEARRGAARFDLSAYAERYLALIGAQLRERRRDGV